MNIGVRLRHHLSDHLEGRWDAFSWYGIYRINADGKLSNVHMRQVKAVDIIKAYEAIAIIIADPLLNRRQESLQGAIEIRQKKEESTTDRQLLEKIWNRLNAEENGLG